MSVWVRFWSAVEPRAVVCAKELVEKHHHRLLLTIGYLAGGSGYRGGQLRSQLAVLALLWSVFPQSGLAQTCVNPVVCENELSGAPESQWGIDDVGDTTIQGFATDISVNVGGSISFKINTNASSYTLAIYRMGYYNGAGARQVATVTPSARLPQTQPACLTDATTNLVDCGNWSVSASWSVPSTSVSGLYFADVTRNDTGGVSQIFFVVRNDSSHSDMLYQTSDEAWQAYNDYGGHSLYGPVGVGQFNLFDRAYKVSYNRPSDTRSFEAATFLLSAEYPMIRWLEANGYDVSYSTDVDAVRNGALMKNHKLLLSVGHDEYVSAQRFANTQAARDAGVNLAFFSGNEFFWKTRWENSTDGSNTPYRTLVCYKETYFNSGQGSYLQDPLDTPPTPIWTGTWRDPRFSPPADGGKPENALTGTLFRVNGPDCDNTILSIQVPAADGKMRFWRNTSIATQSAGQTATLPAGTLGYEWDSDVDNGFRPAGMIPLSTSTYTLTTDLLLDYGATYGAGPTTHHLLMYRAPSGALVFGAGTVQWSWGLDSNHDAPTSIQACPISTDNNPADPRMQQATVNLFADMGIQPGTLQPGLVPATKSTDTTPPTSAITSPASGSSMPYGKAITITGTATDSGGGVVGAVEVSVDGGKTWHPATGREQWSYTWLPWASSGSATVMARAVDDSLNLQPTPSSVTFTVSGQPLCPCSVWNNSATPITPSANDTGSVELGLKFRSDASGFITGVRFYKGANNTGAHIGNLWTLQGTNLATVNFTNETATGWQQANFSQPVAINANTTYIVSYYAPNGGYADDNLAFASAGVDTPPLHMLANSVDGINGNYVYAAGGGFPNNTTGVTAPNYWVDVVFSLVATSTSAISGTITGGAGATVTLSGAANATVTANSSGNYSFPSVTNGTYTVTPSNAASTFTPASRTVSVSGTNVTGVNFTANPAPTFSISGTVTGASAVTITLSGTATATTTTNSSGTYSFSGVINGTYTVTPSATGFAFTPVNQTVSVNGANATGVNFKANTVPTFSLSGTITGASTATVTLSGAATATVTTNASGNYSFPAVVNGAYTVTPSATGFGFTPANRSVTVNGANIGGLNFTAAQAFSIWNNSTLPATLSQNDTGAVEVGLKFTSDNAGFVTCVRFYKGPNNTGTHVGHLWTSAGALLATVTFTGETSSGWQQASFSSPVAISANTTYIVSYYAPNGGYAANSSFFTNSGVNNPPLHALANSVSANGVYLYAAGGGFPSNTFNAANYWVDLVFIP